MFGTRMLLERTVLGGVGWKSHAGKPEIETIMIMVDILQEPNKSMS